MIIERISLGKQSAVAVAAMVVAYLRNSQRKLCRQKSLVGGVLFSRVLTMVDPLYALNGSGQ